MTENLRPWLRLWHRRLRASATWQHLDAAGRGAFIDLIMEAWDRGGPLPNDPDELRLMTAASPEEWDRAWPIIGRKFVENGNGEIRNRLVDEELAHKEERANKGRAAAQKRWKGNGSACKPNGSACEQEQEQELEQEKRQLADSAAAESGRPWKRRKVLTKEGQDFLDFYGRTVGIDLVSCNPRTFMDAWRARKKTHTIREIQDLVTAWAKSRAFTKDGGQYRAGVVKFLTSPRYAEKPLDMREPKGSLAGMDYTRGFDDV